MMYYKTAKYIADRVVELLSPHCELIHIAGSIRRQKDQVKDIEVTCVPKKVFKEADLFGGGYWHVNVDFCNALIGMQQSIIKGNPEGRYMQIILKGGATLDLFMPQKIEVTIYLLNLKILTFIKKINLELNRNRFIFGVLN